MSAVSIDADDDDYDAVCDAIAQAALAAAFQARAGEVDALRAAALDSHDLDCALLSGLIGAVIDASRTLAPHRSDAEMVEMVAHTVRVMLESEQPERPRELPT